MNPDEGDGSVASGNDSFELDAYVREFYEQLAQNEVAFDLNVSDDTHREQ